MKKSNLVVGILCGLLIFVTQGRAQSMFQLTFKGTSQTTNDAGEIITGQINNKTLIQDAVIATGASNASSLALVYVQNASSDPGVPADMIQVINTTNGTPVFTNLQFSYGGLFGLVVTNASESEFVAGANVFPMPLGSGNPTGHAIITERVLPKKVQIRGTFAYTALKTPAGNDTALFCNGTFTIGKPVSAP